MGRKPKAAKRGTTSMLNNSKPSPQPVNQEQSQHHSASLLSKKKAVSVRRSVRLRGYTLRTHNQEVEPVVQHINLVESEKEEEHHVEQVTTQPTTNQASLERTVGGLVQKVEEFKVAKRSFSSEDQFKELSYRRLYIDSQKKIDALTQENLELKKNLEFAQGKLEGYESMMNVIGNLKDMLCLSNIGKATEAMANFSSLGDLRNLLATVDAPGQNVDPPKGKKGGNAKRKDP